MTNAPSPDLAHTIDVIKQILASLKAHPGPHTALSDTADLVNEVGLDSIEMLQFMLEVEARLGIRIDFEKLEYAYLGSIRTLAGFLESMPLAPAPGTPA